MFTEPQLTIQKQYEWFNTINNDSTCKHWIIEFVFIELGLNRLMSEVLAFNERAIQVKEKCGSKTEGILRQYIKKGNTYHDVVVMGILKMSG